MTKDTFGFSAASKSTVDKLKRIQPTDGPSDSAEIARVDAAGEALGFKSREEPRHLSPRRRREIGPTLAINTRAPERVAIPFVKFCDDNRFSYWEGIEELMKRAGLLEGSG